MKRDVKNAILADLVSVDMVKIYTKTGDKGTTSLYGGKRVEKNNLQVSAYGTIDELNSAIGIVISYIKKQDAQKTLLTTIQSDLFTIGSHLAGGTLDLTNIGKRVVEMEKYIDYLDKKLNPLKNFIVPSGSKEAVFTHLARSICRRAEREVVGLSNKQGGVDTRVIIYLNRLSDLLFIVARFNNKQKNIHDVVWKS